jgi:hypothetical protein
MAVLFEYFQELFLALSLLLLELDDCVSIQSFEVLGDVSF